MTKLVRIENADTSDWKVVVQVWDKGIPTDAGNNPDVLVKEVHLDHPTFMASEYITNTRYLIVKEA